MAMRCEGIGHGFHAGQTVLRSVSASFEAGTLTVIVGPNGSGKTTLVRVLAGLVRPREGRVLLGDRGVRSLGARERARRLAFVPQRPEVGFGYTVREVVGFGRFAAGEGGSAGGGRGAEVESALEAIELSERADEPFLELSVGQQQRAVLGRALAQLGDGVDAKVLLADEPVSAMDPSHAQLALGLIRERVSRGLACAVVLHDPTLARRFADRGLVLDQHGGVAASGPAEETLTPRVLEGVFGVRFAEVEVEGTLAIVPVDPAPGIAGSGAVAGSGR
ncbi:MAG: ABC transporter ATP-binding protein [Phycisphaerales bacterium JB040]